MDIQMPELDGLSATRLIREMERATGRAPTPIIALTANAMSHQVGEYVQAGFTAVVAKPIVLDEDAKIDDKGVLRLKGHFDTTPKQVKYQLGFIPSDGAWKLSGISIDIE
jgi:CheY-like chemotaxis protein